MPASQQRVLNKKLSQIFRMRGLQVRPDAMQPLYDLLEGDENWEDKLQALLLEVQSQDRALGPPALRFAPLRSEPPGAAACIPLAAISSPVAARCRPTPFAPPPAVKDRSVDGAAIRTGLAAIGQKKTQLHPLSFEARAARAPPCYGTRAPPADRAARAQVQNVFDLQPLRYDSVRKSFVSELGKCKLLPDGPERVAMVVKRLALAEQRVRRNDKFKPPLFKAGAKPSEFLELTSIDALRGRKGVHVVLGMIYEDDMGALHIEDAHACVPIDLSGAKHTCGFFNFSNAVLVEGQMGANGVFHVSVLGMPVSEPRAVSLSASDSLGLQRHNSLQALATSSSNLPQVALDAAMVMVFSDLWLDRESTIERLETVFGGYEAAGAAEVRLGKATLPSAAYFIFVLCGNFASPEGPQTPVARRSDLVELYQRLADVLKKFPTLRTHSHFVLVPGPTDATLGSPHVLPRPPLTALTTAPIAEVVANLHLTSNPTRLHVCGQAPARHPARPSSARDAPPAVATDPPLSQELVIFREDILFHMRTHAIRPPTEDQYDDYSQHMIETLMRQAHLYPLPMVSACTRRARAPRPGARRVCRRVSDRRARVQRPGPRPLAAPGARRAHRRRPDLSILAHV